MLKLQNSNLQARLEEIKTRNAVEDGELIRQVRLIKGRFRRLKVARL